MLTLNRFFMALAFLGGSAAAQASDGTLDVSRVDSARTGKKLSGIMMASTARLSSDAPSMSAAYASPVSSLSPGLTEGPDNYLPVHHRL